MDKIDFWKDKRVFVTGHTGFKGSWLCLLLYSLGAKVVGYALKPPTEPSLFQLARIDEVIESHIGDVRNYDTLFSIMKMAESEVVIHMAAQPLVLESYSNPRCTYDVNVMGTVNVLEAIRHCESVCSVLNVTTDKVYRNNEWEWGYRETDTLDGFDPYSNSKSCSELVTASYARSFFSDRNISVATARAGNVIGGGDFSDNRIIPDCVRAVKDNKVIKIRNPNSVRPYQHVIDPLMCYLLLLENHANGAFNIGPDDTEIINTGELVKMFGSYFNNFKAEISENPDAPHEANLLRLDTSKIRNHYAWVSSISIKKAVHLTAEWVKRWMSGDDIRTISLGQIEAFLGGKCSE